MPADVPIEVGPTIVLPLPSTCLAATERYSSQVKILDLPGGGLTLTGYRGGLPFPSPSEPAFSMETPNECLVSLRAASGGRYLWYRLRPE